MILHQILKMLGSMSKEINSLPPAPIDTSGWKLYSEELHGIDNPFLSPWEAADKYYPGGFEAYFHEVLCADKIVTINK